MSSEFDKFLELARPNLDRHCFAQVSALLFRPSGASSWQTTSVRVVLQPFRDAGSPAGPRIFESASFRACRGIVPPNQVRPLLDGIAQGCLLPSVLPEGWDGTIEIPISAPPLYFNNVRFFSPADRRKHFRWPISGYAIDAFTLAQPTSYQRGESLLRLERLLTASDPPFAGLWGLASQIGLPSTPKANTTDVLEVLSPFWVTFGDVRIDHTRGELFVEVKSEWALHEEDVSMSLIPHWSSGQRSLRVPVTAKDWRMNVESDGMSVYSRHFAIPDGPTSIHLNFRGESILERPIGSSIRVLAHEIVDPEFALMRSWLSPKGRQQGLFEIAIDWLLHLAGFSSCRYGYNDLQRAVDVQAYLDPEHIVCAECTVEPPSPAKCTDTLTRARALADTVKSRSGRAVTVVPVVFVAAAKSLISGESLPAEVLVLAREDIEDLFARTIRGVDAAALFDEFVSQVETQIVWRQTVSQ